MKSLEDRLIEIKSSSENKLRRLKSLEKEARNSEENETGSIAERLALLKNDGEKWKTRVGW